MGTAWRLIVDDAQDGAWNMAVDRAIQLAREAGDVPPTLRLYSWQVPTLSLGKFQEADDGLLRRCERLSVDVVRRPTGGRGVLHDDEVTYSLVASVEDGVPRGTAASYRHLCAGIVATYSELGVSAALTARDRGERHRSACYLHATAADVSVGAAKLSGSAQVWQGETCLQHGSFTRTREMARERELFDLDDEQAAELARRTATLEELCPSIPAPFDIVEAATKGFSAALGVAMQVGVLSPEESERASALLAEYRVWGAREGS